MNNYKYFFAIAFLVIISLPSLILPFYESSTASENRAQDKFPAWSMSYTHPGAFIKKVNTFYNSNFGLRNHLYDFYRYLKWDVLKENPFPQNVIIAKDGWLFPGNSANDNYNQSLGVVDDLHLDMIKTCDNLSKMKQFCDSLNITFYVAIGPDKASIYPEKLPIKPLEEGKTKNALKSFIKGQNVCVVDMSDYFPKDKDVNLLYYKTDTHWNQQGAYWGTKRLLDEIRKKYDVGDLDLRDYDTLSVTVNKMDLSRQLDIDIIESYTELRPKDSKYTKKTTYISYDNYSIPIEYTFSEINKTKCVVFRDSFFHNMFDFFSSNVGFVVYGVQKFDRQLILQERPNFVVFEIVERRLLHYDPEEFYL